MYESLDSLSGKGPGQLEAMTESAALARLRLYFSQGSK